MLMSKCKLMLVLHILKLLFVAVQSETQYISIDIVFNRKVMQLFDPLTISKKNDLQNHVVKCAVFLQTLSIKTETY